MFNALPCISSKKLEGELGLRGHRSGFIAYFTQKRRLRWSSSPIRLNAYVIRLVIARRRILE